MLRVPVNFPNWSRLLVETVAILIDKMRIRTADGKQSFPAALLRKDRYRDFSKFVKWWQKLRCLTARATQVMLIKQKLAKYNGVPFKGSKAYADPVSRVAIGAAECKRHTSAKVDRFRFLTKIEING